MTSFISVLRLGPSTDDNASTEMLRSALLEHFEEYMRNDDESSTWTISNKYFSAKVLLQDLGVALPAAGVEDGVILVFDSLQSNPDSVESSSSSCFNALESVHANHGDSCGDLLRLCVGVTTKENATPTELRGAKHEDEYSRRILWCLDRGYEYIEADLSPQGRQRGHDERDKEGFARVVEAILGTVWSSAVMGASKKKELQTSYQATKEETKKEPGDVAGDTKDDNPYEPPDSSLLSEEFRSEKDDAEREAKARDALLNPLEKESDAAIQEAYIDDGPVNAEEMKRRRKELEEERVFDHLDGALREAARIRDASLSGTLSDDERRKRAGDAATLLYDLLGSLECGDGEEDSESEGDNEN